MIRSITEEGDTFVQRMTCNRLALRELALVLHEYPRRPHSTCLLAPPSPLPCLEPLR